MDVSQATAREALNQLEQAGLVVRMANRRTTVASFTKDEVRDRLGMRIALEDLAFQQGTAKRTRSERTAD